MTNKDFDTYYNLCLKYISKYGNILLDPNFKTLDGVKYNKDGYNLYEFIKNIDKSKLSKTNLNKLKLLKLDESWNAYYKDIKTYYKHHHNLKIKDNNKHSKWLKEQAKRYINDELKEDELLKLKKINFNTKELDKEKKWIHYYNLVSDYINKYNKEPLSNKNLSNWWHLNKAKFINKELSKDKSKLISNLLNNIKDDWEEKYNILKEYYLLHGNYKDLTNDFKTLNGITYNKDGINLIDFINSIRMSYKNHKLSKERINKLINIHFPFNDIKYNWDYMYDLASNYYFAHDNIYIPKNFYTYDGITTSNSGFNLGKWVDVQRQKYLDNSLDKEKKNLLDELSIVTNPKKNRTKNANLLRKYNIKDKTLINNYPNKELKAKIKYLTEVLHEPLILKNNTINPFLFMGNISLKKSYNITKEDLIKKYDAKEKDFVTN